MYRDEELFKKLKDGIELNEDELNKLIDWEVNRDYGENRRWTRSVSSIIDIDGQLYFLEWSEGLTECQENEFYNQPIKIRKEVTKKQITVNVISYIDVATDKIIFSIPIEKD